MDEWEDVGTKMTGASIILSYPEITQMSKEEQLYTNRYTSHPEFYPGNPISTVQFIGPVKIKHSLFNGPP